MSAELSFAELSFTERANLLTLCRAVMPGVAGVVLSTSHGRVLAHEETCRDVDDVARAAAEQRRVACEANPAAGASTLVARDTGLYLVVFVPQLLVPA